MKGLWSQATRCNPIWRNCKLMPTFLSPPSHNAVRANRKSRTPDACISELSWNLQFSNLQQSARKRGFRVNISLECKRLMRKFEKMVLTICSSSDFAFFSQDERLQLFSGSCPRHLTKSRLRTWLSYRVGTAKDGSASSDANKRELMHSRWAVGCTIVLPAHFSSRNNSFVLSQTYITLSFL